MRKLARRMMEAFVFSIEEAEDGKDALTKCAAAMPTIILLDWYMPVMNGLEFIKALRASPGGDAPKIIFCTTENNPERIMEAVTAGANEFVMKPFDAEILKDKLSIVGAL